jgi:hypothetical protein
MTDNILPWLFGVTMLFGLVFALVQWWSARKARENHEHSAMPPPDEVARREARSRT